MGRLGPRRRSVIPGGLAPRTSPHVPLPPPPKIDQRRVTCYHCGRVNTLSASARSATCPGCYRGMVLEDLVVTATHWSGKVHTCGRVIVEPRGSLVTSQVLAADGMDVAGSVVSAGRSGGPVLLRRTASWRGDLIAPALIIERGARIEGRLWIGPEHAAHAFAPQPDVRVRPVDPASLRAGRTLGRAG